MALLIDEDAKSSSAWILPTTAAMADVEPVPHVHLKVLLDDGCFIRLHVLEERPGVPSGSVGGPESPLAAFVQASPPSASPPTFVAYRWSCWTLS